MSPAHAAGEHLRYLNREVRTRDYLASDEAALDVSVPIAALEGLADAQLLGPGGVPLQLLDTPGPNEAGEESLRFQVCVSGRAARPSGLCLSVKQLLLSFGQLHAPDARAACASLPHFLLTCSASY
jgi:hypothetical protein